MGTTISISFPLGRYHATRWDGGANTSDAEWPPSPWRLLRALIAVRHSRWPELPSPDLEALLAALGTPTAYFTPEVSPGTTRHYMPDVNHARSAVGNTDQVIDAFLALRPDAALRVYWERDIDAAQRGVLAKLLELMPYLGRSESICSAQLIDTDEAPDATWWRLGETGDGVDRVELLAPDGPPRRAALEATTIATRKARRLIPVGSRWVSYGRTTPTMPTRVRLSPAAQRVQALLFELSAQVPLRARNAILATDAMHGLVTTILTRGGKDPAHAELLGRDSAGAVLRRSHNHLHIAPILAPRARGGLARADDVVTSLLLWSPEPIHSDVAARLTDEARDLWVREQLQDGMAAQRLLFAGAGHAADLVPVLAGEHEQWTSAMPYLPVRHRKRSQVDAEFLRDDVGFECRYRGLPEPTAVERIEGAGLVGQVAQFRRRRVTERLETQRRGVYLRITFDVPVAGPLLLGQLSHFGFGSFVPA